MQVKEVLLAIDPAMRHIEEILLWKNKFKTGAVFTTFHFLFWLLQTFNIRTYCTLAFLCLCLHLLDAYRVKRRRQLIKMHHASPTKDLSETLSSLGHYILYVHVKLQFIWKRLRKLKQKNRLQYFLLMLTFWTLMTILGVKVRGFFLSYLLFWFLFFVPAILHYNLARKLLNKALPFLEQLDHSMKYERRSVLDKSELLVDVKLPNQQELDADADEDEYFKSFRLDDIKNMKEKQRRVYENLDDDDDDEDEDEDESYEDEEEADEDEFVERGGHLNGKNIRNVNLQRETHNQLNIKNLNNHNPYDTEDDSLLPDESFPTINYGDSTNNDQEDSSPFNLRSVAVGGRVKGGGMLQFSSNVKSRPSVLEYYKTTTITKPRSDGSSSQSSFQTTSTTSPLIYGNASLTRRNKKSGDLNISDYGDDNDDDQEHSGDDLRVLSPSKIPIGLKQTNDAIDETFDFLDEEY